MKLMRSLIGLAAIAAVVPFQLEKKEDGKSFKAKALLWKVDYNAATDEKEGEVNVNILGDFLNGVQDVANKVLDAVRGDVDKDDTVEGECEECEECECECECEFECEADEASECEEAPVEDEEIAAD